MVGTVVGLGDLDRLDFGKGGGLLPAVVQDAGSGTVLTLGYMNRDAVFATLTRRKVVFFSRTKNRLWEKGETSGHALDLEQIRVDCDRDTLLVAARPRGPVCHLGSGTCFGDVATLLHRARWVSSPCSRRSLARAPRCAPKVATRRSPGQAGWMRICGEGGRRGARKSSALAGAGGRDEEVIEELADLLYHVLVLLKARELSFERVLIELRARHAAGS